MWLRHWRGDNFRFSLLVFTLVAQTCFGAQAVPKAISGPSVLEQSVKGDLRATEVLIKSGQRGTVVVFLSARCPCSASHEVALKRYFQEFSTKGFQFVGVHSNKDESRELTASHFEQSKLPFPVIEDQDQKLANALGAYKTPHAFVLNPDGGIEYQGGVDDSANHANSTRHYLKDALTALAEGKIPQIREARSLGCVIKR